MPSVTVGSNDYLSTMVASCCSLTSDLNVYGGA